MKTRSETSQLDLTISSEKKKRCKQVCAACVGVCSASKTESPRQTGPVVRVSGRENIPPANRHWIPPSSFNRQDAQNEYDVNEAIYRKVRGILNKLTPEKFTKLSDDLLNLGLVTDRILKGVILLIFNKAIDEPKFSFMYAQLCKKLADQVPNFEPPGEYSTFRKLLLNRCRKEFDKRSQIGTYEDNGNDISPDEEERRHIAKCKMLGNIKFIGELAKLEILHVSIVHKCIEELLHNKRVDTKMEDLECLAHLFKTCGRVLETEETQGRMDMYFKRVEQFSKLPELMPRIRFMLCDIMDLRKDNWVQRKVNIIEGPMPIQQIRVDDDIRSRGGGGGGGGGSMERLRQQSQDSMGDSLFRHTMKTRSGFDEMLHGINSPSSNLIPPLDKYAFGGSNGYSNNKNEPRDGYRNHRGQTNFNNFNTRQQSGGIYGKQNNTNGNAKDGGMKYKKSLMLPSPGSMEDGQMLRPAANSLLYKANTLKPHSLPLHTPIGGGGGGLRPNSGDRGNGISNDYLPPKSAAGQQVSGNPLLKEPAITIKQVSDKTAKGKKDKGPNKEEVLKGIATILDDLIASEEPPDNTKLEASINAYKDLKVTDKIAKDVPFAILNYALEKNDDQVKSCVNYLVSLKKESLLTAAQCNDGMKALAGVISQREVSTPRIGTLVAQLMTTAFLQELITLTDVASITENGTHYPLFLLVLQQLGKTMDKQELADLYNKSKINLMSLLPTGERTKERMAEILEERNLSFLFPLLRVQAELSKQLQVDPNPNQFYKWIKENLDASHHADSGFINALFSVLIKYITQESTMVPGVAVVSPPDKSAADKERTLLDRYAPVMRSFVRSDLQLQLTAVNSLQSYCYSLNFPKGMLLRWFVALYDKEICEEEAFCMWKEDISDAYPGKGQALFQVNSWLTWLQTAESDSDETEE